MNRIRALFMVAAGLIPCCLPAQTQLKVTTESLITHYRQASSQKVIAIVTKDLTGKDSWHLDKLDIDAGHRTFSNPVVLLDKLSAIYDTWYDTTTTQVTAIADSARVDSGITYPFLLGAGPGIFQRKLKAIFYPSFDPLGYTAGQNINGDVSYIYYDNSEINFTQDALLKLLGADQLGPMNTRGLAVLHNSKGYFLYHVLTPHTQLSGSYAKRLQPFQSNVFIATYGGGSTLIIVNGLTTDSSTRFKTIERIAGHRPCLDMHNVGTQHILQLDSAKSFLLLDYGKDAADTLMGYPFQDSLLVKIRRDGTDTFYCFDIPNRTLTRISYQDATDKIDILPFEKGYFLTRDGAGMLRISDLSGTRKDLNDKPFKAFYRLYNPKDRNRQFLCLTGDNTNLYVFRITINDADGSFSRTLIASTTARSPVAYAFQHNTLLVKDDAGWRFIDGVIACDPTSSIVFDGHRQSWPWCSFPGASIDNIYFQSRSPFPGLQTMLVQYHLTAETKSRFTLLRIDHPPPETPSVRKSGTTGKIKP